MNELRFLEIMGKIDDDLISAAMSDTIQNQKESHVITKRNIYAFGSVAAVAVITVGSFVLYNAHKPSDLLVDHSVIEQDNSHKDNGHSNHQGIPATTSNDKSDEHTTNDSAVSSQTDKPKEDIKGTVTTSVKNTDEVKSEIAESKADSQTQNTSDSSTQSTQKQQGTSQELKGGISTENAYYRPFIATNAPDYDAYGDDELHHIDVRTADGFYRQLGLDEYEANSISNSVNNSHFGGYIGKIVEVNDLNYHGNSVESQEPKLAGADAYYYAPSGKNKAFIIVKKGDQCSIFITDNINVSGGFKKGLTFFDVQSAADIKSIEYRIDIPNDNGRMSTSAQGTITDINKIKSLYDLLCQLVPENYSSLPEHTGTPQWLVDAWAKYKADSNAPIKENYYITLRLNDGTVLQDIHYQPYLGNGYVENMQELTPEQNDTLRNLFH